MKRLASIALATLALACAARQDTSQPVPTTMVTAPAPAPAPMATEAPAPAPAPMATAAPTEPSDLATWVGAWEKVEGGSPMAQAEGLTFERTPDGGISVYRQAQRVSGGAAVDDPALEQQVYAAFMADAEMRDSHVGIKSHQGAIDLVGDVHDTRSASRAVRLALSVPGVETVTSHLRYVAP